MRFRKILQRKEVERIHDVARRQDVEARSTASKNGSKQQNIFDTSDIKIGMPGVVVEKPPERVVEQIVDRSVFRNGTKPTSEAAIDNSINRAPFTKITVNAEKVNQYVVAITQPQSGYCEEYRGLRTHLIHKSELQALKSIVVVSVGPEEGKSITTLNLAWMLAQTDGVKALVIDGDLRKPSLANYLGLKTETGLSAILAGTASLRDSIVELEPVGLHFLPAGEVRSDVSELISGARFREILAEVHEIFDFVIIDAPPVSLFTDATLLVNHSDGALLVIRSNKIRYSDVERVLDSLPREKMCGVVLNQSDEALINRDYYRHPYYKLITE